jgi:hypothetical protein
MGEEFILRAKKRKFREIAVKLWLHLQEIAIAQILDVVFG